MQNNPFLAEDSPRWVFVKDFYLFTKKDEKGIEEYLKKLYFYRRKREKETLLEEFEKHG